MTTQSVFVTPPISPIRPTIVISAPSRTSPCSSSTFDASGSFGGGGRQLKFFWRISSDLGNTTIAKSIVNTANSANGGDGSSRLTFSAGSLTPGTTYIVGLLIRNFLGQVASQSLSLVVNEFPIPQVSLF